MHEFVLSTDTRVDVAAVAAAPDDRWMQIPHTGIARPALVLLADEKATFDALLEIGPETRLSLRYAAAHESLSADGATLAVLLVEPGGRAHRIACFEIDPGGAGLAPRFAELDLSPWAGGSFRLRLACGAGSAGDPTGDWVAILDLAVGSQQRLGAVRAKAFREERTRNEIAHFSTVYSHAMYQATDHDDHAPSVVVRPLADVYSMLATQEPGPPSTADAHPPPDGLQPVPGDAHSYAHALLGRCIKSRPPNFHARLDALCEERASDARKGPLKVLSLCAGAARIEAGMATRVGAAARWTLLDISEGLLADAARKFPQESGLSLLSADLNEVRYFGEQFDVIMCVSGLHHIVELERVVDFIQDALVDGGEFWSIGEAIGRSGNRLFDDDYRVANAFFGRLPARLRVNRLSGVPDADLPNLDYSEATFEGIRSDEIASMLAHRLEAVDVYRRNCFLWRLVDMAYAGNYDLANPADLAWIHEAVDAELEHFRAGGHPTELHGVYGKRVF